jgi:Flp pilus assembly pilin Flp
MVEYTVVLGVITLAIVTTYAVLSGSIQSILELVTRLFS